MISLYKPRHARPVASTAAVSLHKPRHLKEA